MPDSQLRLYASGAVKLGMGMGIVTVVARWLSSNALISSPQLLVKYGFIGTVGYCLVLGLAFILFAFLARRVKRELNAGITIGDYLNLKLTPLGSKLFLIVVIAPMISSFFLQGLAAGKLYQQLTHDPAWIGLLLFILICVLFAGLGGAALVYNLALFQVSSVFTALILLLIHFFVQEGITAVYDGIRLYHPYLLVVNHTSAWTFLSAASLVAISQVLMDRTNWQRLFAMEEKKVWSSFALSGLIWSTLALAFAAIVMISIFSGSFHDVESLLFPLTERIALSFLIILFLVCLFSIYTASFGAELHSLVSLLLPYVMRKHAHRPDRAAVVKTAFVLAAVVGLAGFLFTVFFKLTPLDLFWMFGVMHSAFLPPFLLIVWSRRKVGNFVPISGYLSMLAAYWCTPAVGMANGIFIAFAASCMQIVLYLGFRRT